LHILENKTMARFIVISKTYVKDISKRIYPKLELMQITFYLQNRSKEIFKFYL
jgi:hypothetical protein